MIKVYLAGPIVAPEDVKLKMFLVEHHFDNLMCADEECCEVFVPKKHRVPNEWGITQEMWGQCVFMMDVNAIDDCDWVVACDFGREHCAIGTAWECGYAFANKKKILIITMPNVKETSLMMEGCASNVMTYDAFMACNYANEIFLERGRIKKDKKLT